MDYKEAMKMNSRKRFNWSNLLGKSLTKYVAEARASGKSKDSIVSELKNFVLLGSTIGFDKRKLCENVEIGVSARFGEMDSELHGVKKGLRSVGRQRGFVRVFPDGKKFVILSPSLSVVKGDLLEFNFEVVE